MSEYQYFLHEILNEQERLIVFDARQRLVHEMNAKNFDSIICDEASDISKVEQLSFTVHTCKDSYKTSEDFLGILPCKEGLTPDVFPKHIQDIPLWCSMDTKKLVSTAFDRVSSMLPLATLLKQTQGENVIHIHSFAN